MGITLASVGAHLVGTIECVVADQRRPAIEYLEAASRVTAAALRERFEQGGLDR